MEGGGPALEVCERLEEIEGVRVRGRDEERVGEIEEFVRSVCIATRETLDLILGAKSA